VTRPVTFWTAVQLVEVNDLVKTPPLSVGFLMLKDNEVWWVKLGLFPNQTRNLMLQLFSQDKTGMELLLVPVIVGFPTG